MDQKSLTLTIWKALKEADICPSVAERVSRDLGLSLLADVTVARATSEAETLNAVVETTSPEAIENWFRFHVSSLQEQMQSFGCSNDQRVMLEAESVSGKIKYTWTVGGRFGEGNAVGVIFPLLKSETIRRQRFNYDQKKLEA